MSNGQTSPITELLHAVGRGEAGARDQLWRAVYDEIHRLAGGQLSRSLPGRGVGTTTLVHEAYLRLFGKDSIAWAGRRHFFAAAARAMRCILVDHARHRARLKRGGGRTPIPPTRPDAPQSTIDLLALDEALTNLERCDPRKAEVVMLRFFSGLSIEETARAMGLSVRTVSSEWRFARAWLHRAMSDM
jgi:RNA polymerase sigma factor (TIGR02999 family)